MTRYVGLDLHKHVVQASLINEEGKRPESYRFACTIIDGFLHLLEGLEAEQERIEKRLAELSYPHGFTAIKSQNNVVQTKPLPENSYPENQSLALIITLKLRNRGWSRATVDAVRKALDQTIPSLKCLFDPAWS